MDRAELEAKLAEKLEKQRKRDMEFMLQHPQTRRILFGLIEGTRSFEVSFTGNSGSYFNDGRKSVGLELFHEVMQISPDSFTLMWNEHMQALQDAERKLAESEEE